MTGSMTKIQHSTITVALTALLAAGCSFLDPLPNGSYNEDNYTDYPILIRGFVDKAYDLRPDTYWSTEFIGTDAMADNAVYRSESNNARLFSTGSAVMSSNPFSSVWTRGYQAINYCNMFLEDRIGFNTHYLVDEESDLMLRKTLQGDAFALRAWYTYDLLKTFGGIGTNGELLGVPLRTRVSEVDNLDNADIVRATFEQTVKQILADCDSADRYLPLVNRDLPGDKVYVTPVAGSVRYRCMDRISVAGLRAMTWLLWASPAFNPAGDVERYRKAAESAAVVMKHKLEVEGAMEGGFNPKSAFLWSDTNSPEIIYVSDMGSSGIEPHLYPQSFGGSADIVPTQELVDAFPAANGYPITDIRSGYNPSKPYENRDPRFYSVIFYNNSKVIRNTNGEVMYTFDTTENGKDGPGLTGTSPTGYYIKKFVYMGWNPYDETISKGYRALFFERWEQMCLIFAEAASHVVPPTDASAFGISARDALGYLRSRTTCEGMAGLGSVADPYLDECAADPVLFDQLVKNEWRITTCFEGMRFLDLRRWTSDPGDLSAINVNVHGVSIAGSPGTYSYTASDIEKKSYPSLWRPLPYTEVRKCPNLIQNAGWESWK